MATYALPELSRRWEHEQITSEQVIGQLILYVTEQQQRLAELEKRLRQLEQRIAPKS
ncbi:MAG: hypothetical protein R3E79_28890 [Caldilineaceae bacterium]